MTFAGIWMKLEKNLREVTIKINIAYIYKYIDISSQVIDNQTTMHRLREIKYKQKD